MLIVKGLNGKSVLASILYNETNSKCFVYDDYCAIHESICLYSSMYSLEDLKELLMQYHSNNVYQDEHFDYLIIYTNQTEEDLVDFIGWLKKSEFYLYHYKSAIVMCK